MWKAVRRNNVLVSEMIRAQETV
uniref:Uncharacterized protein n=1 Tax=Arundo donax TaxID=35708 RepID=A0A0A9BS94_ARUDO